jgi:L-ascorbate metabolism protein UlaG (beta-lactamase superfamily)
LDGLTTSVVFHGVACYELAGAAGRVLIDPFLMGNPAADVDPSELEAPDAILVTHAAPDHVGDAAAIAIRTRAPIVCGVDVAALMNEAGVPAAQVRTTMWGIRLRIGDISIAPVECRHWSHAKLADGTIVTGFPMGFVVQVERGTGVYHFGDSAVFGDMRLIGELHRPAVGLLGCSQPWSLVPPGPGEVTTGEMSPDEAALAAELLGVKYAVGCHYETPDDPSVDEFLEAVVRRDTTGSRIPLALAAGQTLVVDGDTHWIEEAA